MWFVPAKIEKKTRILVVKTKSFCTKNENKSATKYLAIDMQEGLYLVSRYEKKPFREQKKTTLFLLQLGDDGNPKKDADEPVWGYFLQ